VIDENTKALIAAQLTQAYFASGIEETNYVTPDFNEAITSVKRVYTAMLEFVEETHPEPEKESLPEIESTSWTVE
jgi:hypothetical protein